MSKMCHCTAEATVYAMGPYSGDWGDWYCDSHIPAGYLIERINK